MAEIQRSCIWATYHRSTMNMQNDLLVIKERMKDENGIESSHLRFEVNYKRPFWITKKDHRNTHKQKKDFELLRNLDRYECTQAQMPIMIKRALGEHVGGGFVKLSDANASPYVYGTDVTTPVLVKKAYRDRYPDYVPTSTMAVLDYETDVTSGYEDSRVISGAVSMKDKAYIVILRSFLGNYPDAEEAIEKTCKKHLDKYIKERNIELNIKIVDTRMELIRACMNAAHILQPDYLAIWNMVFDVNVMIDECNRSGVDPAEIFCDPRIPREYRSFNWYEEPKIKRKANGDTHSRDPSELWHRVEAPASFYIVDAMCFYRISRVMEGKRNSYSLDSILGDELKLGKLRIDAAAGLKGLDWHIKMQKDHKLEYMAYMLFDAISMELLDEKILDLSTSIGAYADISELKSVPSNPKRLSDACHFFLLENRNAVIASTSKDMTGPLDHHLPSLNDWIITLAAELVEGTGRSIVHGVPDSQSKLSGHNGDIDVASGYPTAASALNASGGTTLVEVVSMEGVIEADRRRNGLDLTSCPTNAGQIGRELYGLPSFPDVLDYF